jgi:ABC-type antimicrobial peptide transport system permease subunit
VLRGTAALAAGGAAVGALALGLGGRALAGLLYGAEAQVPVAIAIAGLLVSAACLAAGWLPAVQASRVDPAAALRGE